MRGARWSTERLGRFTGGLYLVLVIFGMFAPIVFETLVVSGDAVTTASNVLGSRAVFAASLVSWIVIVVADAAISGAFYLLLEPISRTASLVVAALRLVYTAVLGALVIQLYHGFRLLTDPQLGARFTVGERQELALAAFETFGTGFLVALVLFGCHLVALGVLLHRSRYVPVVFGILLVAAGVGYVLDSLGKVFIVGHGGVVSAILLTPALLGELGLTAWLLVKGVRGARRPKNREGGELGPVEGGA